ncbi:SAICAR synthase-like protein [Polychaeton citri CBS 116435]|uniref:1-phosphatidylinositol-4-phosphate 5-kinase n=1 Tax=Polychaeton citri CBS 116435 TaxID=1314669 RepID=A0A9P4Q3W4_9PEZI|nr:SAICAR synthase-like protein [Polychaeton citri CBS 116435]
MGIVNGNAHAPPGRERQGSNATTSISGRSHLEEGSSLPARQATLATDGLLRPPVHQPHRASSPPAFSRDASENPSPPHSAAANTSSPATRPDRLVHRHTLEVPKVITRNSRDEPSASSEGAASTTGRFSPTTPSKRRGSLQLARRVTHSLHSHSDMYLDEVPQDEDAARWAEHIRAKRAVKKARVDTDDDRVVVGTKVDQHHVNWVTAYNMLTGIRFVVSRTNAKLDRDLTEADFGAKHKFSFDITGNELTPSAKYDFKFKDYAPWVFRHLRASFGLDPADYLVSLTSKYILSELGSPGKSGSFFYFSRDYKYIIKTIHHAEHKFLRKVLRDYYDHVTQNPNTLLSQFYGLHRVKMPLGRKIHFVVMNNLFPPNRDIHRTFDLKGSTLGRDFKEEDLEKNPRATLKDLNWLRRNLHLEFGPTKKEAFVVQMQKDVALLQRLNIMDYSLLVGIHDLERGNEENLRDKTLSVFQPGGAVGTEPEMGALTRTPSKMEASKRAKELREMVKKERPKPIGQDLDQMADVRKGQYFYADDGGFCATHEDNRAGEEIYYLGIIDCLTRYGFAKKVEHMWKGWGGKASQISPIPPQRYGDRFVRFISGVTKSRERAEQEKLSTSLEQTAGIVVPPGIEGTLDDPQLGGINLAKTRRSQDNFDPPGTDKVIAKAEKQAQRSLDKGRNELDIPDRSLSAVRTPDGADSDTVMLPVIGEAAESASNASRTPSGVSRKPSREEFASKQPMTGDANTRSDHVGEVPPPTPPKTDDSNDTETRGSWRGETVAPPTPPKDDKRVSRVDHGLPILPKVSLQFSHSPQRAADSELERARLEQYNTG